MAEVKRHNIPTGWLTFLWGRWRSEELQKAPSPSDLRRYAAALAKAEADYRAACDEQRAANGGLAYCSRRDIFIPDSETTCAVDCETCMALKRELPPC